MGSAHDDITSSKHVVTLKNVTVFVLSAAFFFAFCQFQASVLLFSTAPRSLSGSLKVTFQCFLLLQFVEYFMSFSLWMVLEMFYGSVISEASLFSLKVNSKYISVSYMPFNVTYAEDWWTLDHSYLLQIYSLHLNHFSIWYFVEYVNILLIKFVVILTVHRR